MYLGTIWELNIIEMGCRVHAFTSDVGTGASVTYAKGRRNIGKTDNSWCLALRNYTLSFRSVLSEDVGSNLSFDLVGVKFGVHSAICRFFEVGISVKRFTLVYLNIILRY